MERTDGLTLATLLASRICHDLANPVGAIGNGIELLSGETDDAIRSEALALIDAGAKRASSLLQLYRVAFGAMGGLAPSLELRQVQALLCACIDETKIALEWTPADGTLERDDVRLLLCLVLIAMEALPRGGTLQLVLHRAGAIRFTVRASGTPVIFPQAARSILCGEGDADIRATAREANLCLTRALAAARGGDLRASLTEEGLELSLSL